MPNVHHRAMITTVGPLRTKLIHISLFGTVCRKLNFSSLISEFNVLALHVFCIALYYL